MTYQDFCRSCRDLYNKKLYSDAVLKMFVQKGSLKEPEYDAIIKGEPFSWEVPADNMKGESEDA